LRWLGLSAEPEDQREFFFPALVEALNRSGPRVLISGSADEAMAALVVEAGKAASTSPIITVLDRCATPLAINASFAEAGGITLSTAQADVTAYSSPGSFDVVVTHSFLGQFDDEARARVVAKWFNVLAPGGRAITVVRLRPEGSAVSFENSTATALADEVRRRAAEHARAIGISPVELADAAQKYALQRSPSHPMRNLEELTALFAKAGFSVLHAATREWPGRLVGIEGPGLPRGGHYAEIVAERR
jgi:SAM-dependent methyltransferase